MTDGGNILIWFPFLPSTDEKWSVVHHELFHATYSVMDWVNIPLSQDSEEAYAYLLGYITNQFYKKINRQEWTHP